MSTNYGKILLHDNGMPIYPGIITTPTLTLEFYIPFKDLIKKKITEEIGREILNNSKVLMKNKQPFNPPESEESGQSDNIGKNYSIDTKFLLMQSTCYKIAKDKKFHLYDNRDYDYLYSFFDGYRKYKRKIKARTITERNQYEIIEKIYITLKKHENKNLLFILPIPQLDLFFMNDFNISNSFFWQFFWGLSQIKKDCKFKKDIYFAYPSFLNEYNLIKIDVKSFTCESFIKSKSQNKYLKSIEFGMTTEKRFYQFWAEIEKPKECVFKFKYINYK